jgi:hypothetical protein
VSPNGFPEDDINVSSDIFQDFNEDLEANQVMEDERFYRYARFYSVMLGIGFTTFTDNRGIAYEDNHPSFNFGLLYFLDFQNAFIMGIAYSKHTMFIDTYVNSSPTQIIGAVETNMLRPYVGFRYYIDTTDLGTAITYSNPYFVGRVEYWYQTNVFTERDGFSDKEGGGLGMGIGAGLEFPIEIKKTYFNVEFLYHTVSFFDKYTQDYRQIPADDISQTGCNGGPCESDYGYDDLRGDVITIMFNYVISY